MQLAARAGEEEAPRPDPSSWGSAALQWASCAQTPPLRISPPSAGSYSLTFLYTGLSRPSKGFPRFQATAFLNDQAFFHYNSNSGKAEPVGPWSQVEGMEDWEKESQLQRAREEIFLATLKDIMDHYKDSTGQ